jgi:serine/threonine-protein kinase
VNGETVLSGPGSGAQPAAVDLDEKVFTEAVRRGLITAAQGSAALEEARTRREPLLEVLRRRGLVAEEAAKDLDEETREDFVPGYRILDKLGEGGMGVVYRALQKRLDRTVALKVVMPRLAADASYLRRFEREAKAVAKLNHPNVVAAYDYGESKGRVFLAMEFVDGVNCADWVRQNGPMEEARALSLVRDVASGLAHAQAVGIIHRDIKPANILIANRRPGDTASGTASGAKLTDLGLARSSGGAGSSELTAAGAILGTPGYMAPEQAFGKDIDHRADVYALGATLYQIVTGLRPFEASTPVAVIARQQTDVLPDPRDVRPGLSPGIAALLQGMLSREPSTRYGDYRLLLGDLDRVRGGQPPVFPAPPPRHRTLADRMGAAGGGTVALPPRSESVSVLVEPTLVQMTPPSAEAPAAAPPAAKSRVPLVLGTVGAVVAVAIAAVVYGPGGGQAPPAPPAPGAGAAPAAGPPAPSAEKPAGKPAETTPQPEPDVDPYPEATQAEVRQAMEAGDERTAIGKLMEIRGRFEAMSPGERRRLAPRARERLDQATKRAGEMAEKRVSALWQQGEYEKALEQVRWSRERLGEGAGPEMQRLSKVLESIGERGPAEREALRAAREARAKGDPLAALAALDRFETRFEFSPDLARVTETRQWAEAAAPEVTLSSIPPGAAVLVAGVDRGKTPLTLRLCAGDVELELRLDGYQPLKRVVALPQGGGPPLPTFRLETVPLPDPEPAVRLVPDGEPRPLWTGASLGAWSTVAGEWTVSDPAKSEPPANLRGKSASLGMARVDLERFVRGADGWKVEWQMVGEARRTGTVRTEMHFAVRENGEALVLGIDDQDVYLGRRDTATGELVRTHRLVGIEAGQRHTFVATSHGDVFLLFVDKKRVGSVAVPKDLLPARTIRAAVEGGVGFFSDVFVTRMKKP